MKMEKKLLIKLNWKITIGQIVKMMKKMMIQLTEVLPPQRRLLKMSVKLLDVGKPDKITLELPPASTVYFVGDTPESDIRFANSHDASWHSILVKTGVYQAGTEPKYKPKHL